jgi:hypothetical protein
LIFRVIGVALLTVATAHAKPWAPPGDSVLRHDVQVLADAGLIRIPVTTWPLAWPDIARELSAKAPAVDGSSALQSAYARLLVHVEHAAKRGASEPSLRLSAAHRPIELRSFADTPREEGGLRASGGFLGERFALSLAVSAVADASDDRAIRPDGSYAAITLANWIVSMGWRERWWGPGWDGSLILSTNARPVPTLSVERKYSDASNVPLLKWLGPWQASAALGRQESSGVPVPSVRFFGLRVSFRPVTWLEIGLSRTAQWCGEGRACDLSTFGDLLIGRDNRDDELSALEEPGNQLAGYDVRLRSPWLRMPAAAYLQLIGEDEAGALPSRFLGLAGVEIWGESRWGAHRLFMEYADTSCNFSRENPLFDCAYRSDVYPQGYRFRGRAMGHSLDSDGRSSSLGMMLARPEGGSVTIRLRRVELNRAGFEPETSHGVSPTRVELKNLELQYNHAFARGELGVGLGLDDYGGPVRTSLEPRGFLQWRQGF